MFGTQFLILLSVEIMILNMNKENEKYIYYKKNNKTMKTINNGFDPQMLKTISLPIRGEREREQSIFH